jgi:transposase InsO family protein
LESKSNPNVIDKVQEFKDFSSNEIIDQNKNNENLNIKKVRFNSNDETVDEPNDSRSLVDVDVMTVEINNVIVENFKDYDKEVITLTNDTVDNDGLSVVELNNVGEISERNWPEHIAHFLIYKQWPEGVDHSRLERQLPRFQMFNDKLHRVFDKKKVQYIPEDQRENFMKRFHNGLGHFAFASIYPLMSNRGWWPRCRDDLRFYISRCPQCQLHRSATTTNPPIKPIVPTGLPFERFGLDFVTTKSTTRSGMKYIITAIDHATRWIVAKAVKEMTAKVVVAFLYKEIVMNYGAPYEIITDRGSQFLSRCLKRFENYCGIRHFATSSYHPQSNGLLERAHAMVNSTLLTLSDGNPDRWDEYLAQAVFAIRIRTHSVTKYSPFYLMYGMEPRLPGDSDPPSESMLPMTEEELIQAQGEYAANLLEDLGQARAAAWKRSETQAELMKRRNVINDNVGDHYFGLNDWVKLKNFGAQSKFQFTWKGPYLIRKLGPPNVYYLNDPSGKHLNHPYNEADLAPWLETTEENMNYFYDNVNLANRGTQVTEERENNVV